MSKPSDHDLVQHRARNYPYERADHSFVFADGDIREFGSADNALLQGRHPVLAFGSNAAPEQLQRKYTEHDAVCFAVTRATLRGYDVVYSAHLTSYGAVPATLAPSPGTVLETWITWLDDDQLAHMHTTEMGRGGADVNYSYGHLEDVEITVEEIDGIDRVGVYLSNFGALALADAPLAFSRIIAANRQYNAVEKIRVLEQVRDLLSPGQSLEDFIHQIVHEPASRKAWGDALKEKAHALEFPDFVALIP